MSRLPRLRAVSAACLGASWLLLALAVLLQPAFDLRRDLLSDVAADGAAAPAVGQATILACAGAFAAAAAVLAVRALRVAAAAATVAALSLVGVALVQIDCPRGARGCSGPDSGRTVPRPVADVVHRDLVAVFEVAVLVLAVAAAAHLLRQQGSRPAALGALLAAGLSAVTLAVQQRGEDIGSWQLAWLVSTWAVLALLLLAERRAPVRTAAPAPPAHGGDRRRRGAAPAAPPTGGRRR